MSIETGTNYAICREKLYVEEGFRSNIKADPGKETVYGISRRYWPNLSIWPHVDLFSAKRISRQELDNRILPTISDFYRREFWNKVNGDGIARIDLNIAHLLFSIAVNINPKYAVQCIQRALNCLNLDNKLWNDLKPDGAAGNMTLSALNACKNNNRIQFVAFFVGCQTGCYYMARMEETTTKELFAGGWANRIINNVRVFFKK